jgi:hypothetical protein
VIPARNPNILQHRQLRGRSVPDDHIPLSRHVTSVMGESHLGQLRGANRHPIAIEGLWSLRFGSGNAAKTNELIFTSGPDDETHGLLGKLVLAS